jgi:hypothetical protein
MPSGTPWWSVLVEYKATDAESALATQDERFDLFADAVEEYDGVVGVSGSSYSVRLSVLADDAAVGALQGRDLAWKAARHADLPEWPCVRLEAIAHEELEAELDTVTLPALVGAAEVSRLLKVSRQRIAELRTGKIDFPRPIAELAAGPVWLRPAIDAWAASWERKPGRPRKSEPVAESLPSHGMLLVHGSQAPRRGEGVKMPKSSASKSYRSAKSGRFVTKATAKRNPSTTVGERRGKSKGGKKK